MFKNSDRIFKLLQSQQFPFFQNQILVNFENSFKIFLRTHWNLNFVIKKVFLKQEQWANIFSLKKNENWEQKILIFVVYLFIKRYNDKWYRILLNKWRFLRMRRKNKIPSKKYLSSK